MSAEDRSELTQVTIHASSVRPLTFMGGERILVMVGLLLCLYLTFITSMRYGVWYGIPAGGVAWAIWITVMRLMGKSDPQMLKVLQHHRKYRAFYPARGRFDAPMCAYKGFK